MQSAHTPCSTPVPWVVGDCAPARYLVAADWCDRFAVNGDREQLVVVEIARPPWVGRIAVVRGDLGEKLAAWSLSAMVRGVETWAVRHASEVLERMRTHMTRRIRPVRIAAMSWPVACGVCRPRTRVRPRSSLGSQWPRQLLI